MSSKSSALISPIFHNIRVTLNFISFIIKSATIIDISKGLTVFSYCLITICMSFIASSFRCMCHFFHIVACFEVAEKLPQPLLHLIHRLLCCCHWYQSLVIVGYCWLYFLLPILDPPPIHAVDDIVCSHL